MNGGGGENSMQTAMMDNMFKLQAAKEQQRMNMIGQTTPYGSLDWTADPNAPSGYRASQSFSPEIKRLLDSNIQMSQGMSDVGNRQLGVVADTLAKPLDLGWDATASHIADLNRKSLDPIWSQRENDFQQQMANKGLVPGSAAYAAASREFGNQRDTSYNDMLLRAYDTAVKTQLQQRSQPLNELSAMRSGSQIAQPVQSLGLTQTPQTSVQPTDYAGIVAREQQAKQQSQNAMLGGLFGLGGDLLGAGLSFLKPKIG